MDKKCYLKKGACILVGMTVLLLSGCRGNVALKEDFFSKKGTVGLVWSSNAQGGQFYRDGGQGILDQAINNISAGSLPGKIETISLYPLVDEYFLKKGGEEFSKKEFKANLVNLPLDKANLKKKEQTEDKVFWIDFREFKEKYGLDYVLYLDIPRFGAKQNFYGFLALSSPAGTSEIDVYLIETKDNKILGEFHTKKEIQVKEKWDNPPNYPEVTFAVVEALQQSLEEAFVSMFSLKK